MFFYLLKKIKKLKKRVECLETDMSEICSALEYYKHKTGVKSMGTISMNYKILANSLIDYLCERIGVRETIKVLCEMGLYRADLIELKFEERDIDTVIENL